MKILKKVHYFKIISVFMFLFGNVFVNTVSADTCEAELPINFGNYGIYTTTQDAPRYAIYDENSSGGLVDVSHYHGQHLNILYDEISNSSGDIRYNYCFLNKLPIGSELKDRIYCLTYGYSNVTNSYYNIEIPYNAEYLLLVGILHDVNVNWLNSAKVTVIKNNCIQSSVAGMSHTLSTGINPFTFFGTFKTLLPWVITLTIAFLAIYLLKRLINSGNTANVKF